MCKSTIYNNIFFFKYLKTQLKNNCFLSLYYILNIKKNVCRKIVPKNIQIHISCHKVTVRTPLLEDICAHIIKKIDENINNFNQKYLQWT